MLPPTELTLSHHFRNCGTFNCDPVKEASGQRMGDATRARFRSPVDVAEGVETQNATVERNVRVPADVEERAPTTARATASTSPLWLGEFAEPNTTRLSGEARRQQRLSLARGAPWDRI
jgi:hypothetical protein